MYLDHLHPSFPLLLPSDDSSLYLSLPLQLLWGWGSPLCPVSAACFCATSHSGAELASALLASRVLSTALHSPVPDLHSFGSSTMLPVPLVG